MLIIYIRSRMHPRRAHLCHLPLPSQQMGRSPGQGLWPYIIILTKRSCKFGTKKKTLKKEIKNTNTRSRVGHGACRACGEEAEPRTSAAQLVHSPFGGVRVPWHRHGVRERVVGGDVYRSRRPGRKTTWAFLHWGQVEFTTSLQSHEGKPSVFTRRGNKTGAN